MDQLVFPTLKASEIAELARCSHVSLRQHADGTTLIEVGDRNFEFHVVTRGQAAHAQLATPFPAVCPHVGLVDALW